MSERSFDTIIVGAGPAGLSCAAELARAGREVLVLERMTRVGPKPCAGGIPAGVLPSGIPRELVERSFKRQHLLTPGRNLQIEDPQPLIHTVDRAGLGRWMLEQAREAGAEIVTGARVVKVAGRSLQTNDQAFNWHHLVGADGSNSVVRRHLGLPVKLAGIGINYQLPRPLPELEWHFNPQLFGSGYAWIFPHRHSSSAGVYGFRRLQRSSLLHQRFLVWAHKRGLNLEGIQPRASLVSFDYRGSRFGDIFLTGDAAGLASGLTGEGIAAAIISGQAAARAILAGDGRAPQLGELTKRHALHRRLACLLAGQRGFGVSLALKALTWALEHRILSPKALELGH